MTPPLYRESTLTADAMAALSGPVLLDFGTEWCGHCAAVRGWVDSAVAAHPAVRHLRIEDGRGRPLGRALGVKLWPTLVFLREGQELARCVRPQDAAVITRALARIDPT